MVPDVSADLSDVFSIEEDISKSVLQALKIVLSPEQRDRLSRRPTDSDTAYDAYLRGLSTAPQRDRTRRHWTKRHDNSSSPCASIQHLRRRTPVCARRMSSDTPTFANRTRSPRPRNPARKAVQLDSNLPDVHLALGFCTPPRASSSPPRSQYRKAIAQDGDLTEAYLGLASALSERDLQRPLSRRIGRPSGRDRATGRATTPTDRILATEGRPADAITSVSARDASSRRTMRPCTATSARRTSCSATSAMPRRRSVARSRSRPPARATRTRRPCITSTVATTTPWRCSSRP